MAYAYAKNYHISIVGIRFFNVYGPWGRPDMSIYKFTSLMLKNKKNTTIWEWKTNKRFYIY